MYALAPNGYVRWRVDLGHQFNSCPQIPDGWGDHRNPRRRPQRGSLYVVDAFGRLHALDLGDGPRALRLADRALQRLSARARLGRLDHRRRISLRTDRVVLRPLADGGEADPGRPRTKRVSSWVSVPFRSAVAEHLRLGRPGVQREDRLALRRHRPTPSKAAATRARGSTSRPATASNSSSLSRSLNVARVEQAESRFVPGQRLRRLAGDRRSPRAAASWSPHRPRAARSSAGAPTIWPRARSGSCRCSRRTRRRRC